MKRLFRDYGTRRLLVIICIACTAFMFYGPVWGIDSPGLSLRIYGDENYPDLKFPLGQPVKVIMVIKNDTNFDINAERGFSKLEPHRHLVLFAPDGTQHVLGANVMSGDAPPPFFLGNRATVPAEKLPGGWVKSETIVDLTELFPVMKDTVGLYTLETHMPFMQLVFTINNEQLGLLGVLDSEDPNVAGQNWEGTLDSNKLQIEIELADTQQGAHLKVQVLDQSYQPSHAINQVPVRVYDSTAIAGLTPSEVWANGPGFAVLTGLTNEQGWAVWDKDLCRLERGYTAIAYYQQEYRSVLFSPGEDGWSPDCAGVIEKTIHFGQIPDKIIYVSGSAYNFPEDTVYKASFAMDVSTENGSPSGWLKYHYTRTRMNFVSTAISEVTGTGTQAGFKGTGTVNGLAGYTFEADVIDDNPDKFGITIKDSGGSTHYSNALRQIEAGELKVIIQTAAEACEGDFDGDGDVDGKDTAVFVSNYGKTNCTEQSPCQGNYDGDDDVDNDDFSVFIKDFGKVDCPQ